MKRLAAIALLGLDFALDDWVGFRIPFLFRLKPLVKKL